MQGAGSDLCCGICDLAGAGCDLRGGILGLRGAGSDLCCGICDLEGAGCDLEGGICDSAGFCIGEVWVIKLFTLQ